MIISASGGLVYHARAAFMRMQSLIGRLIGVSHEDRWAPTRRCVSTQVARWLTETQPDTLLLFGPSGGYLLESDFFANLVRSKGTSPLKIVAIDPDPIAALIFRYRFSSSSIEWHYRNDLLPFTSPSAASFGKFLGQFGGKLAESSARPQKTAVLFFGVLGQLALHRDLETRPAFKAREIFKRELSNFSWASLHDLESTTLKAGLDRLPAPLDPETYTRATTEGLLDSTESRAEFSAQRLRSLGQNGLSTAATTGQNMGQSSETWIDHDTSWLGQPEIVIPWLLNRHRLHLLGFTRLASKTSIVGTD